MKGPISNTTYSKTCEICQHPERAEIERLILSVSPSNPRLNLASIADAYGVSEEKLRVHALMHSPMALDFSKESEDALVEQFQRKLEQGGSSTPAVPSATSGSASKSGKRDWITDKVNMHEGDMLLAAANEYLTTITTIGRRLKRYASDGSDGGDQRLVAMCSTSLVNLYIGAGSEMRKAIQELRELNRELNGSHDSAAAGLQALASALAGSSTEDNGEAQFLDTEFETKEG